MASTYQLPKWGLTMEDGTIVRHLVVPGTRVAEGQPIAIVETDKIEVEFGSPVAGIIATWLVSEGENIPVGTDVVVIASDEADYWAFVGSRDG